MSKNHYLGAFGISENFLRACLNFFEKFMQALLNYVYKNFNKKLIQIRLNI